MSSAVFVALVVGVVGFASGAAWSAFLLGRLQLRRPAPIVITPPADHQCRSCIAVWHMRRLTDELHRAWAQLGEKQR